LRFWILKNAAADKGIREMKIFAVIICALNICMANAADFDPAAASASAEEALAATATNQLGVELHHQLAHGDENLCLSPYSIQSALAMTFAGADGKTRTEMARVLHFPNNGDAIHASFAALERSLEEMAKKTAEIAEQSKKEGGPSEPITLAIANRLFAQIGYDFRNAFRELNKKFYGAPFEPLDFKKNPERGTPIHQQMGRGPNARSDSRFDSSQRN
jgi:serpin B